MPPVGKSPSRGCLLAPKGPGGRGRNRRERTIMEETTERSDQPIVASGEKTKARDIIAAIRTLQTDRARAAAGHAR